MLNINKQHYNAQYLIDAFLVPDIHLGVIFLPLSRLSLMFQCRLCCPKVPRCLHDVLWDMWVYVSESAQSTLRITQLLLHNSSSLQQLVKSAKCHLQTTVLQYLFTSKIPNVISTCTLHMTLARYLKYRHIQIIIHK